jgi:hypothetical protein
MHFHSKFILEFHTMSTNRTLFAVIFAASVGLSGAAQAQSAPAAPAPAVDGQALHDCAKPTRKHDHGAEKGIPTPMAKSAPCTDAAAATLPAAAGTAAKKHGHNHSTFHKTM